ncbi:hypothetical protein [Porphyromonas gingivalis]|uniref:Uncharacterized protein n=1 Tax=Porphyromonas phage phage025a_SJD11 TaxID=3154115 RepID=A0AAT9JDV7_9CAUD|nr:hypothetical protein [Porphyromonas gingivalis]OWR80770.1 hypothetical protein SJDPG11_03280 [Porphyromonas gingivalis SJD11]
MKKNKIKKLAIALLGIIALLLLGAVLQAHGFLGNLVSALPLTTAAIVPIADIKDVPDIEVAGKSLGYRLRLIRSSDVDRSQKFTADESKPGAIKKIPLLEGAKFTNIECHAIPEFTSKGSKGDITVSGTNTIVAVLGGFREDTLRFIEQHVGGKFLVIFEECGPEGKAYLVGDVCKPMVLKEFDNRNNHDSRSCVVTFENESIYQPVLYTGGESNGAG